MPQVQELRLLSCPSLFYTGSRAGRTEVVHIQVRSHHGFKTCLGHKLRLRSWKTFPGPTAQSWLYDLPQKRGACSDKDSGT